MAGLAQRAFDAAHARATAHAVFGERIPASTVRTPFFDVAGGADDCEWAFYKREHPVPYAQALAAMEAWQEAISTGSEHRFLVWLCVHEPVYTAGTSAHLHGDVQRKQTQLNGLPLIQTGRGGRVTYHGPGQRVVYVVCDLRRLGCTVGDYVRWLERWGVAALAGFNLDVRVDADVPGVWARPSHPDKPSESFEQSTTPQKTIYVSHRELCAQGFQKIVSLGVRVRKGVTCHGFAINGYPCDEHIMRTCLCGLKAGQVSSLAVMCPHVPRAHILQRVDHNLLTAGPRMEGERGMTLSKQENSVKGLVGSQKKQSVGGMCYGCH
jgi:lipoyl(octanoyl) transferase